MKVAATIQDCITNVRTINHSVTIPEEDGCNDQFTASFALPSLQRWADWFDCWIKILQDDPETAAALQAHPNDSYELTLRLTTDQDIQSLNAQYRHQNRPTDVLAFATLDTSQSLPTAASPVDLAFYLGDIAISVETAQRQASQQRHTLVVELAWLAAHGFLHLLGWDHPDEISLKRMLQQQTVLLQSVGLSVTLESLLELSG